MSFFNSLKLMGAAHGASQKVSSDGFFVNIMGGKTHAGPNVTHGNSMNIPAVYAAVRIIADGVAMLPADVRQKRKGRDGSDPVNDHPVSHIFNVQPNPRMTAFTCRSTIAHHQVLWGNGYGEIEKNGRGESVGLWPLLPDRTRAETDPQTKELFYSTSIDGQRFDIENEQCLHIPALAWDGITGYSPVALARQAFGLSLATEEFGAKFFGNDAKSGGFLMHPAKLGDKASTNLSESMNKRGDGLKDAHRIRILEEGMKFVQTTIPPDDAQFLLTREFQIAEIARMFGVPLFLLQSTTKSTSWGSGIESMGLAFLMWTLTPWIVKMEQEVNRKMFTTEEREKGLFMKLNVNALLRGDMAARSTFYNNGINGGWMTRNEVRNLEDKNPIPGLDKPLVPLNMVPDNEKTQNGIETPDDDDDDDDEVEE